MSHKNAALFAAALGAGALTLALAALPATTARATPSPTVIDLAIGNDGVNQTDVGAPGLSVGDEFVYADTLYRDGRRVGEDGSSCQVTRVEGERITTSCVLSVLLPEGQITAQSLWTKGTDTVRMAVTGGTGAYRGASGELTCNDIQTPRETYHIELDR
ncbi:hypothetical protein FKN01_18015 [Streptomyces sp. 130]|uniref:allene oxide cyclase barrel-like domain-containing protein n=1 Tax=Streptomyces sp. 130 TaxID=2591006 RepID=UPI00117F7D58|nr:hypothetical protein [Streptomyces sp. 130]TRV76677.1 hypothetical protein FKN01_18015 [Streptomyces sp. 130]